MSEAPTGTISFLFTDIVGSTKLWERFPNTMGEVIARHDTLIRHLCETRQGFVFKTVGDAFCVAFHTVRDAVLAAIDIQRALALEDWGEIEKLLVRMGIHTGTAEFRDKDYFGGTLNRVARIEAAGHGEQILLSQISVELLSDEGLNSVQFKSLGEHRLRNLERPEHLFQAMVTDLPSDFPAPRSMEVLPNNLPVQTTSFIGREKELEEVHRLMEGTHLLTITGMGGTGKTRLALEIGATLINEFRDGVWLVELAPVTDPQRIPEVVAGALNVREEAGQPMQQTLVHFLRGKDLLLILDNCEHLLPQCAVLVSEWLRASQGLRIMAASRHSLGVSGETTFSVPPLGTYDTRAHALEGANLAAGLSQYDAVKLFVERAVAVNPSFSVTNANAPAVAEICARLDGIPLAIELAAARVRLLTPEQIAARLDDQFRLLRGGTGLPHQQTLQALIDWSYDLLSEAERILFRRLGVFVVGRTLEGIETVCSGEGVDELDVLDLLQQLVDKSLVSAEQDDANNPRYTMTESVWQYSRQKLEASGEGDVIRNRHLDYFLAIAEKAAPHFEGPEQKEWLDLHIKQRFNYRAAGEWAARSGRVEEGMRLLVALNRLMEVRGNLTLVQGFYESYFAHPAGQNPTAIRARALEAAGRLSWVQDQYDKARKYYEQAIELAEQVNLPLVAAFADTLTGFIDRGDDDLDSAEKRFHKGLETAEKLHDERLRSVALSGLGSIAQDRGDLEKGLQLKEESLAIYRKLGDYWIMGYILWGIARAALEVGKIERAEEAMREWAKIAQNLGNQWLMPYVIETFAEVAVKRNESQRAARLFGAGEVLRGKFVTQFSPKEQSDHDHFVDLLRKQMPPDQLLSAWQSGRELSLADALKEATGEKKEE